MDEEVSNDEGVATGLHIPFLATGNENSIKRL